MADTQLTDTFKDNGPGGCCCGCCLPIVLNGTNLAQHVPLPGDVFWQNNGPGNFSIPGSSRAVSYMNPFNGLVNHVSLGTWAVIFDVESESGGMLCVQWGNVFTGSPAFRTSSLSIAFNFDEGWVALCIGGADESFNQQPAYGNAAAMDGIILMSTPRPAKLTAGAKHNIKICSFSRHRMSSTQQPEAGLISVSVDGIEIGRTMLSHNYTQFGPGALIAFYAGWPGQTPLSNQVTSMYLPVNPTDSAFEITGAMYCPNQLSAGWGGIYCDIPTICETFYLGQENPLPTLEAPPISGVPIPINSISASIGPLSGTFPVTTYSNNSIAAFGGIYSNPGEQYCFHRPMDLSHLSLGTVTYKICLGTPISGAISANWALISSVGSLQSDPLVVGAPGGFITAFARRTIFDPSEALPVSITPGNVATYGSSIPGGFSQTNVIELRNHLFGGGFSGSLNP